MSNYRASGTCRTDFCNFGNLSCLSCTDCQEPTKIKKMLCTSNDNMCFVGIKLENGKYDQGCTSVGKSLAPYSATGTCLSNDCNKMTTICNFCFRCLNPTYKAQIICTSTDNRCYVRDFFGSFFSELMLVYYKLKKFKTGLTTDGSYDQGCRSSLFLTTTYAAYSECDTLVCNNPRLVCFSCKACSQVTNTTQIFCPPYQSDACYVSC
jgi:hypothetical protein